MIRRNMAKIFLFFSLIFFPLQLVTAQDNKVVINKIEWSQFFNDIEREGTFILTKLNSDTLLTYNSERAATAFLPASTFKILNSLISLESNVIKDENELIKWDGIERSHTNWNQDMNMKMGIKYSCVWFYQELARRVGKERMQHFLDTVKYGNSKIGSDIDKFWLVGDLRITALEQIGFLTRFLNKDLPFQRRNLDIVENILLVDSTDTYRLYAKTGWTARVIKEIGWYVGFLKVKDETWVFAMNIDIIDNPDAKNREEITRKILMYERLIN